ncbi:MAG: tRNA (cytosine(32)/uridine(32)-2'-O)-methyltransferase TrmJ [Gammaproteobacteria bacterium]|nr:tRNA (cytosine(32)/uridine(32)-2'-O)-methyltransferase TrmJ [Gammaproteobacteria bacterium]
MISVLASPSHPGNIGAVARSLKTMGLSSCRLVSPDDYPSPIASARASGALDVLNTASLYETFEEAIADCRIVAGTSARLRSLTFPHVTPRQIAPLLIEEAEKGRVAVCYGREECGLLNEQLARCHYHIEIPANPAYSSLNLGSAVQVMSYELRQAFLERQGRLGIECKEPWPPTYDLDRLGCEAWDEEPATAREVDGLINHFERATRHSGFLDPKNPMLGVARLRRLFNRARVDRVEINILRGILNSIEKMDPPTNQRVIEENYGTGDGERDDV